MAAMLVKGGNERGYSKVAVEFGDLSPGKPEKRQLFVYSNELETVGEVLEEVTCFFRNEKWWPQGLDAASAAASLKDGTQLHSKLRAAVALMAPEGASHLSIVVQRRTRSIDPANRGGTNPKTIPRPLPEQRKCWCCYQTLNLAEFSATQRCKRKPRCIQCLDGVCNYISDDSGYGSRSEDSPQAKRKTAQKTDNGKHPSLGRTHKVATSRIQEGRGHNASQRQESSRDSQEEEGPRNRQDNGQVYSSAEQSLEDEEAKSPKALRFRWSSKPEVEVPILDTHTGEMVWAKGQVTEDLWVAPDGTVHTYLVSLESARLGSRYTSAQQAEDEAYSSFEIVYVPVDSDQYIRLDPALAALRFREKDEVECFVRNPDTGQQEWFPGVVLCTQAPTDEESPYLVELKDPWPYPFGRACYASISVDLERLIRVWNGRDLGLLNHLVEDDY